MVQLLLMLRSRVCTQDCGYLGMIGASQAETPAPRTTRLAEIRATIILLAPWALLAWAALTAIEPQTRISYVLFSTTLAIATLYLLARFGPSKAAATVTLLAVYLAAYTKLTLIDPGWSYQTTSLAKGLLLLIPAVLLFWREGLATGGKVRRAKFLIGQLLSRTSWPERHDDIRNLPEVRSLREVLVDNPGPILPLLAHPQANMQIAALMAMDFQPIWRKGQAEVVILRANSVEEPAVRACAMLALAKVKKTRHLACMLPFLSDNSSDVRRATAIAVLWDAKNRWPEIRSAIRHSLANARAARDGALPCSSELPQVAIDDLMMWSGESGSVGVRSTQTLIRHCKKAIKEDGSPEAIARVCQMIQNPKISPGIRVELAHRLKAANEFSLSLAQKVIDSAHPTMLRVLAAGAILAEGEDAKAIEVLRLAARQSNREIGLVAASIIQKYLGVDLGLPVGGDLPAANSRQAAEVARHLLKWAAVGHEIQSEIETPLDGVLADPVAISKTSRH
jgi:hypothetical protein